MRRNMETYRRYGKMTAQIEEDNAKAGAERAMQMRLAAAARVGIAALETRAAHLVIVRLGMDSPKKESAIVADGPMSVLPELPPIPRMDWERWLTFKRRKDYARNL